MAIFDFLLSPERRLRRRINDMYKSNVRIAMKSCDDPILAGLMIYGSISSMYNSLKKELAIPLAYRYNVHLNKYFKIVEESLETNMNKYIKNWKEIKNGHQHLDPDIFADYPTMIDHDDYIDGYDNIDTFDYVE